MPDEAVATSTTRLGAWFGHELRLGRQQHLIFVSERTRLAVLIPARDSRRLAVALPGAITELLANVVVPAAARETERQEMAGVVFARTNDRSVLGTLNDFVYMARELHRRGREETPDSLMWFFAQTPILPLGGARPLDLTRQAFDLE